MTTCPNYRAAIETLRLNGINFVAVDFDDTLISKHTGGTWKNTANELARFVRPVFKDFLPLLLISGIYLAIVTFSKQNKLVTEVIQAAFPDHYQHIFIRSRDCHEPSMNTFI